MREMVTSNEVGGDRVRSVNIGLVRVLMEAVYSGLESRVLNHLSVLLRIFDYM